MKMTKILLLILYIFQMNNCEEKKYLYRCGVDDKDITPLPATNFIPIDKGKKDRRLNDVEYKDFHIYLDLLNIKKDIINFHLEEYEDLFISSLNKAVETLQTLLKVRKLKNAYMFLDSQITDMGIEVWNKTVIGNNSIGDTNSLGIDLFIFGRLDDEMDPHTLATAGPRLIVPETGQPLVGLVNINTKVDYSKINSKEYFQSIILHEFTHILGFLNYHFINFFHNMGTKVDDFGVTRYYINSSKVIEVAKKYYNCPEIDGIELEESGGEGTAGSHWEARILLGDYMNGVVYPEEQVISEFTLALLEDTGYYKANYYTGGLMQYGRGKGCDFIKKRCVNEEHEINPLFENEFYDSVKAPSLMDASCSSGRQSRTYRAWWLYNDLPTYYQYFPNPQYGGYSAADYCPVSKEYGTETESSYYSGHCSLKGNGEYGTRIYYETREETRINETHVSYEIKYHNFTSEKLKPYTGEIFSDHSFCYQSSLIKENADINADVVRAICYESFCSELSLTIKINEEYIVCPRSGGKIELEGYKGFFLCPDYNLICSGKIICNDMFDCVDKKSEVKEESYNYDYTIKTSQNLEEAEISMSDEINNYELGVNGICPINCKHCHENNICMKCRNDYGLIGAKENNEIKCLELSILSIGYYQDDNIYYKCIDHCDICTNNIDCDTCSQGYEFANGKCLKQIQNCEIYGNDDSCIKCKENYAFKKEDRTACFNLNTLDNYYTKDEGISYYPCDNDISNCDFCSYDSIKMEINCDLCKTEYALFKEENKCLNKEELNKKYFYLNNTHINKCSNVIEHCDECINNEKCLKCKNNYFMINDDEKTCVQVSNINIKNYYLNNDKSIYYSCDSILYQDIPNCKECSSKSICTSCQNNYTFIDGNKSNCIEKDKLKDKYIQDPSDNSNFIKCENKFSNCDTCNNEICISCKNEYIFINDIFSNCILKSSIDLKIYFTTDNITYYSCKEEAYKKREECLMINTEISKTEIQEISSKNHEIFILQVQLINKLLKIYLTSSSKIEKDFHIKLSVDLYKSKRNIRNLQESPSQKDYQVDFFNNEDNEIQPGNIFSITSKEEFDEGDRIVVNENQNINYGFKILNNNNKILDTKETKKMIDKGEIVDFSNISTNYQISEYLIESSSQGCEFDLVSKDNIKENKQNIILNFIEKDNKNNNINIECIISSANNNKIPCSLEQEVDNNYNLNSYVGSNEKGLYYIKQENQDFHITCQEKKSNKRTLWIILGIVGAVILITLIIVLIVCCPKKNSTKEEKNKGNIVYQTSNSENDYSSPRPVKKNKTIKKKKKSKKIKTKNKKK